VAAATPLSTLLSQVLIAFTVELDNEFERRFQDAGGGARVTSLTMWANLLRFVGDGTSVGELVEAVGLPKQQALSRLGGVERWRYVTVGPATGKREGYGSARGTKDEWSVRFTPAGERAAAIWPALPGEIEARWRGRFGARTIDGLAAALRAVEKRIEVALPAFLPVVSSTSDMALELPSVETRPAPSDLPLVALLAHALMAYTVDFEARAALSLPLAANAVRVLGKEATPVPELPARTGISKEAVAVSLTSLSRTEYVVVEGAPASRRTIRLTSAGRELQDDVRRLHSRIRKMWEGQHGATIVGRLHESLDRVLEHPDLAAGLTPYPDGWRAGKPYAAQTDAMLADPTARLPRYPMVLHRGGWPDGS
jgi:DNA-binding MarR family transcriptional regulator